jgi:hypothetical protein
VEVGKFQSRYSPEVSTAKTMKYCKGLQEVTGDGFWRLIKAANSNKGGTEQGIATKISLQTTKFTLSTSIFQHLNSWQKLPRGKTNYETLKKSLRLMVARQDPGSSDFRCAKHIIEPQKLRHTIARKIWKTRDVF